MPKIEIAGIMRDEAYSPNNIGNDSAVFNATADELRKRGCRVNVYSERQFLEYGITERFIFDMCRQRESVAKLQRLEDEGRLVVNSGYGIENCTREKMTRLFLEGGVPGPESIIVDTDDDVEGKLRDAGLTECWVKRADFHAVDKEDVSYCPNLGEVRGILRGFCSRGISRAVINRHLDGDLIKFYGVRGRPFFYWFYPFDEGHSKYGYETVNGRSRRYGYSLDRLKEICRKASEITDVMIYGGDCIVDAAGDIRIIDFNDWPSFSPCRAEAAPHIAECILNAIKEWKEKTV